MFDKEEARVFAAGFLDDNLRATMMKANKSGVTRKYFEELRTPEFAVSAFLGHDDRKPLANLLRAIDPPPLEPKAWALVIDLVAGTPPRRRPGRRKGRRTPVRFAARDFRALFAALQERYPGVKANQLRAVALELVVEWYHELNQPVGYEALLAEVEHKRDIEP